MASRGVEGIIYVEPILTGELANIINPKIVKKWIESITHFSEAKFEIEFVPAHLDSTWKKPMTATASYTGFDEENKMFKYKFEFEAPMDYGEIGALLVQNKLHKERFIKKIDLDLDYGDLLIFNCESWVHSVKDDTSRRIFFTDKSYLPSETPAGLKSLREEDLESLRGDGTGRRESFERIYDYDTYNDLGEPDIKPDTTMGRPILGGKEHPYPRRCRTGRDIITRTGRDKIPKEAESREHLDFYQFYVPRDESFADRKVATFGTMEILFSIAEALKPSRLEFHDYSSAPIETNKSRFEKLLEYLNDKWSDLNHLEKVLKVVVPKLLKDLYNNAQTVKRIHNAQGKEDAGKPHSWFRDEEFCRQTLAGINPYSIKLVTESEWPLKSKLPCEIYGPPESTITKEIVEKGINRHGLEGFITCDEALKGKRLFMLDYNDLLLPHVHIIRKLTGTTLYGSRTLMFLMSDGTLTPVAIELTRPPIDDKPQWKHVYIPYSDYKEKTMEPPEAWLWKMAKAHVLAHDSGYHQLISHWLRTHCATEPYIIATHRCLSKMHPIHRLLFPHLRYTMQINALARQFLINAGGIIESTFSPGKYSMKLSSDIYAEQWRFDREGLPADLISRGMAVEVKDPSAKNGVRLKLTIEHYPFAHDGLVLWYAIEDWATAYVNYYYPPPPPQSYPQPNLVSTDEELKAWWHEIKTVGHADKKVGWPELRNQEDLIGIVTTIMWVTSGHHSAVNFGQYTGGYLPHRPTIARTKMPNETDQNPDEVPKEWEAFLKNPKDALKNCLAMDSQSSKVKTTLNVLSSHSQDEEYIGDKIEFAWEAEPAIKDAFLKFKHKLDNLGNDIDSWNKDRDMKNRHGDGKVPYPYELLKPFSGPGVTGKGVPYSISI
ncbi:hypothetical protein OSB04_010045 [Centaurea solstitialis]|uniref:Lipoxygenase n=1 Tax=Centaurea solstitialis TaxID=347529 RepID=A0AA38THL9_9ASTR|nr:hypothetical protein OSB04_010045 [Centaurea solstitialis]